MHNFEKKEWARGKKPEGGQYWVVESDLNEADQLNDHFNNLLEKLRPIKKQELFKKKVLDVGIIYSPEETVLFCGINFDAKYINSFEIILPGLVVDIAFYPEKPEG